MQDRVGRRERADDGSGQQRDAAAAAAGFDAVECQFPYELPAAELARLLREYGLTLELIILPAGDWASRLVR